MSLRAYFDTNIWISYIQGPEAPDFDLAEKAVKDIKKGKYIAVVSYFVLSEILNVLRRIVGNKFDILKVLTFNEQCKYVEGVSRQRFHDFIKILLQLHELVELTEHTGIDADVTIFHHTLNFIKKYFGIVRMFNRCNVCKTKKSFRFFSIYSGLGPADFIHIILALSMGCHCFITLDKGFKSLREEPVFSPIVIEVLER